MKSRFHQEVTPKIALKLKNYGEFAVKRRKHELYAQKTDDRSTVNQLLSQIQDLRD